MGRYALDMEKYADLARTASAEGCVLLKNDNSTLPLKKGDKVARTEYGSDSSYVRF